MTDLQMLKDEPVARFTSAHVGGPADCVVVVESSEALVEAVRAAQTQGVSWHVLGSGSNVLVADAGVRGWVIVNRARQIVFRRDNCVYAQAGANLSSLARNCIARGWAGLEWAVSVPGTVGGAVVGNAGAHGGDVGGVLQSVTVLEPDGAIAEWPVERLAYSYRDSVLKRNALRQETIGTVLAATFALRPGDPDELARQADVYVTRRKATQPPGATMGSTFKNPPGDYAGRLIEAAGLKGTQVGGAQISPQHANFFVNTGHATAADLKALIDLAREQVQRRFGVALELEIELVGEWEVGAGD